MSSEKKKEEKPRGRYGDGSIRERKDGRFEASFYIDGKRKSVYGKTRAEVRKKLKEAKLQAEAGTLVASSSMTVQQWLEQWLEVHKLEVRASTYTQYRYGLRAHVFPALGNIRLQKLTEGQVQAFVGALVEELAPSTVGDVLMVLNMALNTAVRKKLLGSNPCTYVTLPRVASEETQALSAEQAQALMHAACGTELECIVTLALATGMRRGELLGLKWSDIDFEQAYITVARTLVYVPGIGRYLSEPKTKSGKRRIVLASFAADALSVHKSKQQEARSSALRWRRPEMVFTNSEGDFFGSMTLQRRFEALLAQVGLSEDLHFHCLRHSAATLLLSMGVPARVVQQILGHSDIRTTLGIYGHVLPGQEEQAIEGLHLLLTQPKKETKKEDFG